MRDPRGMADRVADRDRAAEGDAEQNEALDAHRLDHRLQVGDEGVVGEVRDDAVRQTVAPRVVADEGVLLRQLAVEVPPHRAFEVVFEMRRPARALEPPAE
jgi:hypothetical protein